MADPFDAGHLMGHVKDAEYFEVPRALESSGKIHVPQIRPAGEPIFEVKTSNPSLEGLIEPLDLRVTKFMMLEVLAALIICVVFIGIAQKISTGKPPRGKIWNLFESILLFLRDEVARPAIGHHDGDKFLPYIWTIFFFVLTCNLLGMVPWLGSPTGALGTTAALALMTFFTVIIAGMKKMGVVGFWKSQVPHMDLPFVLAIFLKPMIFVIEILGLLIRHFVLSVRLLANMMAGHLVLAVLIAFIAAAWGNAAVYGVGPVSILGATALSVLELFVAFLQAYIFAFLSALFIGMAVHPH